MISRGTVASVLGMAGVAGALLGAFAAEIHGPIVRGAPFAPLTPSGVTVEPTSTDRPKTGPTSALIPAPELFTPFIVESPKGRVTVITTSDPISPADPGPTMEPPATSDPPKERHGGPPPSPPPLTEPPPMTTDPEPTD